MRINAYNFWRLIDREWGRIPIIDIHPYWSFDQMQDRVFVGLLIAALGFGVSVSIGRSK